MLKLASAAILACGLCLLLKKTNPELGLGLSLAVCCGGFALALGMAAPLLELLEGAKRLSGLSDALFYPVVKSVGIALCAKLGCDVCKDSGQTAIAGSMETLGAVCALYAALPLFETLLDMLEELA